MTTLSALFITYAGFALFQAVAARQPLDLGATPRARLLRTLARPVALLSLPLAAALLEPGRGWTEAWLMTIVLLVFVASVFVLVAPVAPRIVWGLAIAAPMLSVVLTVVTGAAS
jgi:hypothetical protein